MGGRVKRILVLFPNEWDYLEFGSARYRGRYEFRYAGFDLFKFPENARLMIFNAQRFIERIVKRFARAGLDGVLSTDEHFGAMVTAVVAERLGLPGAKPESILIAQHKYYARLRAAEIAPEVVPRFAYFPYSISEPGAIGLPFPLYVKPVKSTYSILARRVNDFAELRAHLTFKPFEKLILEKLIAPFNQLGAERFLFPVDAHHLVAEELLLGEQVTIEGLVHQGQVTDLGVVDSIMYPGTSAFKRFDYPSALTASVQARMADVAAKLVLGYGFTDGLFNAEFFYDVATDVIKLIELNPRMAYQFADMREKVDGLNPYDALLALTVGESPVVRVREGRERVSASFVLRAFGQPKLTRYPSSAEQAALAQRFPDARLVFYIKKGGSLEREMKWLGSYRYALINLAGQDVASMHARFDQIAAALPFEFAK